MLFYSFANKFNNENNDWKLMFGEGHKGKHKFCWQNWKEDMCLAIYHHHATYSLMPIRLLSWEDIIADIHSDRFLLLTQQNRTKLSAWLLNNPDVWIVLIFLTVRPEYSGFMSIQRFLLLVYLESYGMKFSWNFFYNRWDIINGRSVQLIFFAV